MLAACEMSGVVRDAFEEQGWDAWSCDLLPTESLRTLAAERHLLCDVRGYLLDGRRWDLIIGFPPCTDLSLAGANRWALKKADGRMLAGAQFFMTLMHARARYVAIENPRGIMSRAYRKPDQVAEPWWFGDPYSKKTCLWLRNLPPLVKDNPVTPAGRIATGGGSWRADKAAERRAMNAHEDSEGRARRAIVRSRTLPGIARAMAVQWTSFILAEQALHMMPRIPGKPELAAEYEQVMARCLELGMREGK